MANATETARTSPFTNLENDENSLRVVRWFLKPICAWPLSSTASISQRIFSKVVILSCIFVTLFILISCALNTIFEEGVRLETKLRNSSPIGFFVIASLKYTSLILHLDDIRRCVKHIENDWRIVENIEDHKIMLKNAKVGRFIAGACGVFIHTSLFSYVIAKVISPEFAIVGNDSIRSPPYAFYNKIWNTRYSPAYEVVTVMQCFTVFIANSVTAGSCGMAAVFVMHARGQLRIARSWLQRLVREEKQQQQRLGAIVRQHLRVLSFTSCIEDVMHVIAILEIMGCTLRMCMLGYCAIAEWNLNERGNILLYSAIFVSITFNIFILCYIGETLSGECRQIGEVAYMIEWYRLPVKTALCLNLIILRSSILVKMTAGKIIQLSLPTFMDVLKMSLTYLNVLRTLTTSTEL
ncbi:hypothetical protein KM043_005917 [Ampulex compressa]|nr:hypothetical protein KM043_005917 [Ampulex compressa]